MPKTEKLTVWVSPLLKKGVYREAQLRGMNMSEYVRHVLITTALERKITELENKAKQ